MKLCQKYKCTLSAKAEEDHSQMDNSFNLQYTYQAEDRTRSMLTTKITRQTRRTHNRQTVQFSLEKKKKKWFFHEILCGISVCHDSIPIKQSVPVKALHLSNHKNHSIHKFQIICKNPSSLFTSKIFNLQSYDWGTLRECRGSMDSLASDTTLSIPHLYLKTYTFFSKSVIFSSVIQLNNPKMTIFFKKKHHPWECHEAMSGYPRFPAFVIITTPTTSSSWLLCTKSCF